MSRFLVMAKVQGIHNTNFKKEIQATNTLMAKNIFKQGLHLANKPSDRKIDVYYIRKLKQ